MFDHHLLVEGAPGLPGNGAGQTVARAGRDDSDRNVRGDPPVLSIKETIVDLVQETVTRHDDDSSPSPDILLCHQLPSRMKNIIIESELYFMPRARPAVVFPQCGYHLIVHTGLPQYWHHLLLEHPHGSPGP